MVLSVLAKGLQDRSGVNKKRGTRVNLWLGIERTKMLSKLPYGTIGRTKHSGHLFTGYAATGIQEGVSRRNKRKRSLPAVNEMAEGPP
jgi:hypothetical protein